MNASTVDDTPPAGPRPWHALSVRDVMALLQTDPEHGLTTAEARRRIGRVGPNQVADTGETPLWRVVLRQFRSLVVLLLLVAAGLAWGLGERAEAIAILAALVLNAAIGFSTEWRAQVSLAKLRALTFGPHECGEMGTSPCPPLPWFPAT